MVGNLKEKKYIITETEISKVSELMRSMHIVQAKKILQDLPELKDEKRN